MKSKYVFRLRSSSGNDYFMPSFRPFARYSIASTILRRRVFSVRAILTQRRNWRLLDGARLRKNSEAFWRNIVERSTRQSDSLKIYATCPKKRPLNSYAAKDVKGSPEKRQSPDNRVLFMKAGKITAQTFGSAPSQHENTLSTLSSDTAVSIPLPVTFHPSQKRSDGFSTMRRSPASPSKDKFTPSLSPDLAAE